MRIFYEKIFKYYFCYKCISSYVLWWSKKVEATSTEIENIIKENALFESYSTVSTNFNIYITCSIKVSGEGLNQTININNISGYEVIYDLRSDDNLYIYNKNIEKSSDLLTGEIKYDDVSETVKNPFTYETIIDYIDRYANETIINYYT